MQEAAVKKAQFTDEVQTVSTLEATDLVQLAAQAGGRVDQLNIDQGDVVEAGQLLVVLDQEQEQAALRRDVAKAETDQINYQRYKFLAEQGAVSEKQRDQYRQQAISSREKAIAQQATVGYNNLTSPINGVVADVSVKVGDVLKQGQTFTQLVKNNKLEARIELPSVYGPRLKTGLPVVLMLAGSDKPLATSTVSRIDPTVSSGTQALLVKSVFENPEGTLRNGQRLITRVELETKSIDAVPFTAVTTASGQNFVFRVGSLQQLEQQPGNAPIEELKQLPEGTKFALQTPVEVGTVQNNLYPVLKGVKAGEMVITSNLMNLKHGSPVQIKPPADPTKSQNAKGTN
ncbi:MAG: efflux RND transporter periplasmic adaptor subunit [Synechococcus sp. MED-G71]|nr:MAG: efflux RND transporter periplasmic adaptor subunit [Synechococcus sp. MED-G71]